MCFLIILPVVGRTLQSEPVSSDWATYLQPAAGVAVASPVDLTRNTTRVMPIPFSKGSVDVRFSLFFGFLPGTADPPTMFSVAVIEPVTGKALLNLAAKDREGVLEGLPGGVAGPGGTVIKQEPYRFKDFPGREFIVRSEVGGRSRRIYGRTVLIGNRILALNVWGAENLEKTPGMDRFFDSFRLMTDGEKRLYGTTNAAEMIPVDAAGREIDPAKVKPLPPPDTSPSSDIPSGPIRRAEGVLRDKAVNRVTPEYPEEATAARIQGDVVCEILIDEEGKIVEAKVLSGPPELHAASLAAVRQWTFKPTLINGKPVEVIGVITFRFNLGK